MTTASNPQAADTSQREQDIGSAQYTHTIARKRTAAAVLFTDEHDRVLLCEPSYKLVWELPGGAIEADESPRAAAAREVAEELGLTIEPGHLIAVDYISPTPDERTEAIIFVYDGGHLTADQIRSITLDTAELRSWSWSTIAEARQRMRPLVARRIEAARKAIDTGTVAELENGYSVVIAHSTPRASWGSVK